MSTAPIFLLAPRSKRIHCPSPWADQRVTSEPSTALAATLPSSALAVTEATGNGAAFVSNTPSEKKAANAQASTTGLPWPHRREPKPRKPSTLTPCRISRLVDMRATLTARGFAPSGGPSIPASWFRLQLNHLRKSSRVLRETPVGPLGNRFIEIQVHTPFCRKRL